MYPYHVALAGRTVREHQGYALAFDDGTSTQMVLEGEAEEYLLKVMEEVLKNTGMERQVVLLTRSKTLLAFGKDVAEIFPNITFMAPYDHVSEEMYRIANEHLGEIVYPDPPTTEIGTDASASNSKAVWAWVRRKTEGELDFGFGISPVTDINAAEMIAILQAGFQGGRSSRPLKIYSDSRNAIKMLNAALEAGGEMPEILQVRGRKNIPALMEVLVKRHEAGMLEMEWVKGHSDHALNVLADQISTYVRRRLRSESRLAVIRAEVTGFIKEFERNGTVCFA